MIKLLTFLLALLGALVIVVLSVDNRAAWSSIVFWPLPFTYQMPLYAVFLIGLVAGALLGGTATWLSAPCRTGARPARCAARSRAVEYQDRLKREREEQEALEQARRKTQSMALTVPQA